MTFDRLVFGQKNPFSVPERSSSLNIAFAQTHNNKNNSRFRSFCSGAVDVEKKSHEFKICKMSVIETEVDNGNNQI